MGLLARRHRSLAGDAGPPIRQRPGMELQITGDAALPMRRQRQK